MPCLSRGAILGVSVVLAASLAVTVVGDAVNTAVSPAASPQTTTAPKLKPRLFDFRPKWNISYKGDISDKGPCKEYMEKYCSDIDAGDGARAHCLSDKVKTAFRNHEAIPVSKECRAHLEFFHMGLFNKPRTEAGKLAGVDISPTSNFREHCEDPRKKFCAGKVGYAMLMCLKQSKAMLPEACRQEIGKLQSREAMDMTMNQRFNQSCHDDLLNIEECANLKAQSVLFGTGQKKACLKKHRKELSAGCQDALFAAEVEESEDLRFDRAAYYVCRKEIKKFCKDTDFGKANMQTCLFEHIASSGFSFDCKVVVEQKQKRTVTDFRLDYRIANRCKSSITTVCQEEKQAELSLNASDLFENDRHEGHNGGVLHCLKAKYDTIKDKGCQAEVQRVALINNMYADSDPVLRRKCKEDVKKYCQSESGSSLHHCLRNHMDDLDVECKEAEIVQGAVEAHDMTMKQGISSVCAGAVKEFCKDVPAGGGRLLMCLQKHLHLKTMPPDCGGAVQSDLEATQNDWRLKYGFQAACMADAAAVCPYERRGGGSTLLECMVRQRSEIKDAKCRSHIKESIKVGMFNIKALPYTYSKCIHDVQNLCPGIEAGSGRIHNCLLSQKKKLSSECAAAEFELQKYKAEDITMSIKATTKCKAAMEKHCSKVTPGNGNMWKCLEEKKLQFTLSEGCVAAVDAHIRLKNSEFYLNPQLSKMCDRQAKEYCQDKLTAAEAQDFSSDGQVISCLIDHRDKIEDQGCQDALFRKMVQRIESLDHNPVAHALCTNDAAQLCPAAVYQEDWKETQSCLMHQIPKLGPPCRMIQMANKAMQSEDMRLNPELKKNCVQAKNKFCKNDKAQIGCLLDHMHDSEMDSACYAALEKESTKRSKSISYNPVLKKACSEDLEHLKASRLCSATTDPEKGEDIQCLTQHSKNLTSPECQRQVQKVLMRHSDDIRSNFAMLGACHKDLTQLCPEVAPGRGRANGCLFEKLAQVENPICKKMVEQMKKHQSENAMINSEVRRQCVNERKAFCADVEPGKSKLVVCLNMNKAKEGFSQSCRLALSAVPVDKKRVDALRKAEESKVKAAVATALAEVKAWVYKQGGLDEQTGVYVLFGSLIGMITGCALLGLLIFLTCRRCRGHYQEIDSMA